jgi:hypothetical protein
MNNHITQILTKGERIFFTSYGLNEKDFYDEFLKELDIDIKEEYFMNIEESNITNTKKIIVHQDNTFIYILPHEDKNDEIYQLSLSDSNMEKFIDSNFFVTRLHLKLRKMLFGISLDFTNENQLKEEVINFIDKDLFPFFDENKTHYYAKVYDMEDNSYFIGRQENHLYYVSSNFSEHIHIHFGFEDMQFVKANHVFID